MDERLGDVEPPPHPARVLAHQAVAGVGEPELLEQLVDPPLELAPAHAEDLALQAQVLAPGRLLVEAAGLGDDADRLAHAGRFAQDVEAGDPAAPPSGWARVVRIFTVVDLPAPFGPSRPNTVPSGTAKERPSSACTPSP